MALDQTQSDENFLPDFCGMRMVFGLVILAELFSIVLVVVPMDHSFNLRWQNLGLTSLFVQWCALGSAAVLCTARSLLNRFSSVQIALLSYFLVMLVIVLASEGAYWVLVKFDNNALEHRQFLIRNVVIGAVIAGPVLRYFYIQYWWQRRIQAETQARLQALQSRIRPHFLFNSMNTIASLIPDQPKQAELAVENLSDLFRSSLSDATQHSTLSKELELCRGYVQIEQLRIGEDRLTVHWKTDELPSDALIPPLTLQPLLENAIYHGIGSLPEGGAITITGAMHNKQIEITLTNPMPPAGVPKYTGGNQMAQDNIRERLRAFYQRKADINFEEKPEEYKVILKIPYLKPDNENTNRR